MNAFQHVDLFSTVAAAAQGVARALRRDPASAVLFWGDPPELEVVHNTGLPEDVCRSLTASGGRHVARAVRVARQPVRVEAERLPPEASALATALRTHDIGALAVFPLFGESGIVGCLVVPLDPGMRPDPAGEAWRTACRALGTLQVAAGGTALGTILEEDRRRPLGLCDGVLVVDRWERVLLADGLVREGPAWRRSDPLGRSLNSLPGGALLGSVHLSKPGQLEWEEHLLPPIEGHGVPVAIAALPGRLVGGELDGSRVVLVRDLRTPDEAAGERPNRVLALGLRVAHALDELERGLPAEGLEAAARTASPTLASLLKEAGRVSEVVRSAIRDAVEEDRRAEVDFNAMFVAVQEQLRIELEADRVRVFSFLRPELPAVAGDALQVMRCIHELVGRARRSLRGGGGTLTLRTWADDGWVCAAISDDGIGAVGAAATSAVEPLFRAADDLDEDDLEGVYAVMRKHGGRLQVESRPRVWNRYTLMLPVERRLLVAPARMAPETTVSSGKETGALEVLVVDDNGALRSVLRRYLERRGHRVTEAQDGEQALGMVSGRAFDRVIVDIHMPGKSGPEFYTCLGDVAPGLRERTLFMTGGFLEDETERFLADSGRPAIKKPFDLAELAKTVEGA